MEETPIINGAWLVPSEALTGMASPAALTNVKSQRAATVRFGYRVGSLQLLVSPGVLSELMSTADTYPLPNVPHAMRGYVNRQGALVPVWDLRLLLGDSSELNDEPFSNSRTETTRLDESSKHAANRESILLLGRGDLRVGLIINGLPQALKQSERVARLPQLPDELTGFVKEALYANNSLWFEFDHEGFFRTQTEKAAA